MRDRGRLRGRAARAALPLAALGLWLVPSTGRAQDPVPGGDAPAADGEHPFVSDGVYAVEYAEDPRISPDGAWVAYVRRFADRARNRWHTEIVRVRADGSGRESLSSGPSDRAPRFSADGTRLAYVAAGDGFHEIRVISLATRRRRELAAGSRPIGTIAWAPIGDRIAFLRHGSELDTLVHLHVADVSSGAVRRLTTTGFEAAALDLDTPLAWVPDGSAVLFSAGAGEPDVLEIPASGGSVRRITSRRGPDEDPSVSPDGRLVAYSSADSETSGAHRLHLIERSGRGQPRVLHGRDGLDVYAPAWSPDGREVFALVEGEGAPRLVLVELDGSVRVLADGLGAGPVARARSAAFSVSADSANPRFAATAIVRGSPGEVVVGGRRRSDTPRRVTWTNDDVDLDTLVISREIRIAPDVPARLYTPAEGGGLSREGEAAREGRLPALLVTQGGCGPRWIDGFDLELTALAAAGYVVLALDPDGRVEPLLAAADSLASRPGVAGEPLFLLERSGDGTLAREALAGGAAFRRTVVHRPPGCGDGPDAPSAERDEAAAQPDTAHARATEPAFLVIESPAHPFDEPPSAFVARLRRTLDRLAGRVPIRKAGPSSPGGL